jgi:RHS repeat-associated protein
VVTTTGSDKFTYAGEMQDSPTGLVYLFARYYDPELGRFYALDPELGRTSNPQILNRYTYCINNPLKYFDPTGRNPVYYVIAGAICAEVGFKLGVMDAILYGHPEYALQYGAAGAITWAQFPLIYYVAGPRYTPGIALPILGGEYNFLKTYFVTGDLSKAMDAGGKGFSENVGMAAILLGLPKIGIGITIIDVALGGVLKGAIAFAGNYVYHEFSDWWNENKPSWMPPLGKNPYDPRNLPAISSAIQIGKHVLQTASNYNLIGGIARNLNIGIWRMIKNS